jgi:hypothetical protein
LPSPTDTSSNLQEAAPFCANPHDSFLDAKGCVNLTALKGPPLGCNNPTVRQFLSPSEEILERPDTHLPTGLPTLYENLIIAYTSRYYRPVNVALRNPSAMKNQQELYAAVGLAGEKDVRLLTSGSNGVNTGSLPDFVECLSYSMSLLKQYYGKVWRGASLDTKIFEQYQSGKTITERAFSSTSTKVETARAFSTNQDPRNNKISVIFEIISKNGRLISLSRFEDEQEVVFLPGTRFNIAKVVKVDSKFWVYMTQID